MQLVRGIRERYVGKCLDANIVLMAVVGGWPILPDDPSRYLRFIRHGPYLSLFSCTNMYFFTMLDLFRKLSDFSLLSEIILLLIDVGKAFTRLMIIIFQMNKVTETTNQLDRFVENLNEDEEVIFQSYNPKSQLFTVFYIGIHFMFGCLFSIEPLFDTTRRFPGHFEFPILPFDAFVSPAYEIVYTISLLITLTMVVVISLGSGYIISALIYTTACFKLLQHRLEHARGGAINASSQLTRSDVSELGSDTCSLDMAEDCPRATPCLVGEEVDTQEAGDALSSAPDRSTSGQATPKVTDQQETPSRRLRTPDSNTPQGTHKTNDQDLAFDRYLTKCIKFHQDLISFVEDFQEKYRILLVIDLSFGALMTGIALFQIGTIKEFSAQLVLWVSYLCLIIWQLLSYCWVCSEVAQESALVSDAMYFCDWLEAPASYKRAMKIVMTRAVQPLQIGATSFLPFTMEMFTNVINSGYSYFNLVNSLQAKT